MGLFDSKAKRIEHHRQLIELARATLESLNVKPDKGPTDNVTSPIWTETTRTLLPLEYRWWVGLHVETLTCAVYDTEPSDLGNRDWIRELAESVTAVRSVMSGLPDNVRNSFRADTFARIEQDLDELITVVARNLATDGMLAGWADTLERTLNSAREALTWFGNQEALNAASALRRAPDEKLPKPYVYKLKELVRDGEATLASVRKKQDERQPAPQP